MCAKREQTMTLCLFEITNIESEKCQSLIEEWCIFVESLFIIINSHNDIKFSSLTIYARTLHGVVVYSYCIISLITEWTDQIFTINIQTKFGNLHDELFHTTQFFHSGKSVQTIFNQQYQWKIDNQITLIHAVIKYVKVHVEFGVLFRNGPVTAMCYSPSNWDFMNLFKKDQSLGFIYLF